MNSDIMLLSIPVATNLSELVYTTTRIILIVAQSGLNCGWKHSQYSEFRQLSHLVTTCTSVITRGIEPQSSG